MPWWGWLLTIWGVSLLSALLGYALACILYTAKGD